MWTQRAGAPSKAMDWRRFSSQRMLSLCSMGTRVGLILRLSAAVPLNCCRDQNFTADRPNGRPAVVTAREVCMRRPHTVCIRKRPALSLPLFTRQVMPTASARSRWKVNSVVSWMTDQNGAVRRGEAVARGLEMAGEDLHLADPIIGEEAVGGLRARPVLARERQAAPDRARHALDEVAQALAQARIHEDASGEFALPPRVDRRVHEAPHPQAIRCPTRNHLRFRPRNASAPLPKMWVIERSTGCVLARCQAKVDRHLPGCWKALRNV